MNDESKKDKRIFRRKLLALVASGSMALLGGGHIASTERGADPYGSDGDIDLLDDPNRRVAGSGDVDAENIADHGAEPNPNDPSLEVAMANLDAILDAAESTGEGGAIFIPSGTFYIGHDGDERRVLTSFGDRDPAGVSIYGDGPGESTLGISSHIPNGKNHNGLIYEESDHGPIRIENVRLDGNYGDLGDLHGNSRGSRGVSISGSGRFDFFNVYFDKWYTNAVRPRDLSGRIEYCTFVENGIGLGQDSGGQTVSHHIACRPARDNHLIIRNCHFDRTAGSVVNINGGNGTTRMENCYATSAGSEIIKLSAGKQVEVRNCYFRSNTPWIETNMPVPSEETPFHGRHMIKRLFDRGERNPVLVMEDVEFHDCTHDAIKIRNAPVEFEGDMIAIHNGAGEHRNGAIREESNGALENVNVGRLSVHDCDGDVFDFSNSFGTVDRLHRSGNDGLGKVGEVTIRTDNRGAECFHPRTPSRHEVGIYGYMWRQSINGGLN